jgi:hypothetical protein
MQAEQNGFSLPPYSQIGPTTGVGRNLKILRAGAVYKTCFSQRGFNAINLPFQ